MKKFLLLALSVFLFSTALERCVPNKYTSAEHKARIEQRVEDRFFGEDSEYAGKYTDYEVYICYDFSDQPIYFMVEFEPVGFIYGYIYLNDYYSSFFCPGFEDDVSREWFGGIGIRELEYTEKYYDENGNEVIENKTSLKSDFYVAGMKDERRYIYIIPGNYVTAKKENDVFIPVGSTYSDIELNEESERQWRSGPPSYKARGFSRQL